MIDGNPTTPVVPIPEVVCTRSSWFRADGIATAPLLDFKLLPKSRSAIPLSSETIDLQAIDVATAAGSRSTISGSALMLSESDKDNEALDRHRPDRRRCSPLPSSALRDNADADAKARYAASRSELQVSRPLLLDFARRSRCHR